MLNRFSLQGACPVRGGAFYDRFCESTILLFGILRQLFVDKGNRVTRLHDLRRSPIIALLLFCSVAALAEAPAMPAKASQSEATQARSRKSIHGPYANDRCPRCHSETTQLPVTEINRLCIECHMLEDFPGKVVHGPVASGNCFMCHESHESRYPHLLRAENDGLCSQCHADENSVRMQQHRRKEGPKCYGCHDPHASDRTFMLKAPPRDVIEERTPAE